MTHFAGDAHDGRCKFLAAIGFDHDLRIIRLHAVELLAAQACPKVALGVGHLTAELAGEMLQPG